MALRILIPLVLGAAAGCTTSDGTIDYRVSGGYRVSGAPEGDGTALHVDPDGTATRTSPSEGPVTEKLDPATLADLRGKVAAAGFPHLQPRYECQGCADSLYFEIAVQLDGQEYSVTVDTPPDVEQPDALRTLIGTLRQLAPPSTSP